MDVNTAFGMGLKRLRKQKGLTQEDFSGVSSRTYLSTLERGLKGPTIEKIEQLALVLNVHPATLVVAAYAAKHDLTTEDLQVLASQILLELGISPQERSDLIR